MALQGSYTFKGIVLSEAYCNISNLTYSKRYNVDRNLVSSATYNSDGTIENEAVYENVYTPIIGGNFVLNVHKDSSSKESNPQETITVKNYEFTHSIADDADNFIVQAYTHLKSLDEFDGYTDV